MRHIIALLFTVFSVYCFGQVPSIQDLTGKISFFNVSDSTTYYQADAFFIDDNGTYNASDVRSGDVVINNVGNVYVIDTILQVNPFLKVRIVHLNGNGPRVSVGSGVSNNIFRPTPRYGLTTVGININNRARNYSLNQSIQQIDSLLLRQYYTPKSKESTFPPLPIEVGDFFRATPDGNVYIIQDPADSMYADTLWGGQIALSKIGIFRVTTDNTLTGWGNSEWPLSVNRDALNIPDSANFQNTNGIDSIVVDRDVLGFIKAYKFYTPGGMIRVPVNKDTDLLFLSPSRGINIEEQNFIPPDSFGVRSYAIYLDPDRLSPTNTSILDDTSNIENFIIFEDEIPKKILADDLVEYIRNEPGRWIFVGDTLRVDNPNGEFSTGAYMIYDTLNTSSTNRFVLDVTDNGGNTFAAFTIKNGIYTTSFRGDEVGGIQLRDDTDGINIIHIDRTAQEFGIILIDSTIQSSYLDSSQANMPQTSDLQVTTDGKIRRVFTESTVEYLMTGNYVATEADHRIINNTVGDYTLELPTGAEYQGKEYIIKNYSTGSIQFNNNNIDGIVAYQVDAEKECLTVRYSHALGDYYIVSTYTAP